MLGSIRTARAVVCWGRRRGEKEGLGDVGYSSNRLKWYTDPSQATCITIYVFTQQKIHKNNNIKKNYHCSWNKTALSSLASGEPAIAADVCLRTMVVLGLQLLVHAERASALHGRDHRAVQVEDVRFRLQEALDGPQPRIQGRGGSTPH